MDSPPPNPDPKPRPWTWDSRATLALVFLVGLALRLWGITWGLPNREHFFSYHPDEILILRASQAADVWSGHFNPHFYNYGSLQIYLNSLFRPLAYAALAPSQYTDYLLGRVLTALMGAGTILLTYGIARRTGGKVAGFLAAFLVAFAPAHALHSHYLTVDVSATFWVMLSLYSCLRVNEAKGARWSLLAGAAAGLAAGTKYNVGVVVLPVLLVHWPRLSSAWRAGIAFLLALFLSTPGILLWTGEFWRDFGYELAHTRQGHAWVFVATPPAWVFHWVKNLRWGLGLPLLLLATAGLISACVHLWSTRRERRGRGENESKSGLKSVHPYVLLLSFLIPYYLVIGTAEVKFLRYTIPLIPPLMVLLAAESARVWEGVRSGDAPEILRPAVTGIGGVTAVYTLLYCLAYISLLSRVPPQDAALGWLLQNAAGRSIGLTTVPWFYSPPVSPYNAGPQSALTFERHRGESPFRLEVLGTDANRLEKLRPDVIALSKYETADVLRLSADPRERDNPDLLKSKRFLDQVGKDYRIAFRAQNRPGLLPSWLLPQDLPPHDWLYPYPIETIWVRR